MIREALERAGKAGVGQVVIAGREHLVVVAPLGKGLVLEVIRYGSELKPAEKFFGEIPEGKLFKLLRIIALAVRNDLNVVGILAQQFQSRPQRCL